MSDSKKRSGLGICDVLAIVFIVLKLLGVINWSCLDFHHHCVGLVRHPCHLRRLTEKEGRGGLMLVTVLFFYP